MATTKTLVVLHGSVLPYQTVQECCSAHNVSAEHADITTQPAALVAGGSKYSKAVVLCSSSVDAALLGAVAKLLTPGSSVALQLHQAQVRPALLAGATAAATVLSSVTMPARHGVCVSCVCRLILTASCC